MVSGDLLASLLISNITNELQLKLHLNRNCPKMEYSLDPIQGETFEIVNEIIYMYVLIELAPRIKYSKFWRS